jgi:TorA maturation chaperone TorD
MLLRLFQLGILIGLVAWAAESLDLSRSATELIQTALGDWSQSFNRRGPN